MSGIVFENLSKTFETEKGRKVNALSDINIEIEEDEFVTLLGPSGSGKSTLLRLALGLTEPTEGRVVVGGNEVDSTPENACMVFQEYSLMQWRTVIDNVVFGLEIKRVDKKERYRIGMEILENFGLKNFEKSYPYELSGGMQQRVAIARTIANSPKYLFMDEPFGALDAFTRFKMQKDLIDLWIKDKQTVLFVTHSVEEAVYISNRIVILSPRPGRVYKIYENHMPFPRDRYSEEFQSMVKEIMNEMISLDNISDL